MVGVIMNREKKKKNPWPLRVISIVAVLVFIISGNFLGRTQLSKIVNASTNDEVADVYKPVTKESEVNTDGIYKNFEPLLAINPDTKGWLTVPNTKIDYPVVYRFQDNIQKDTDYYYLSNDFNGDRSKYGALFFGLNNRIEPDYTSQNLTIHGHHMKDGQMFGELKKYRSLDFYKQNPTFTMDTLYEKGTYEIFSVFLTNSLPEDDAGNVFDYTQADFESQEDFMAFTEELKKRSFYDIPVDIQPGDQLVTLSTCEYDFDQSRLVVVGRKVRPGEEVDVSANEATKNPDPLYPQVWYDKHGGSKPE